MEVCTSLAWTSPPPRLSAEPLPVSDGLPFLSAASSLWENQQALYFRVPAITFFLLM